MNWEEVVVRQCAPTLAGIKTGNLFSYRYDSVERLLADLRDLNRILIPRGMRLLILRRSENSVLLYLYRPARLERDLENGTAQEILQQAGYPCTGCASCVCSLIERFRSGGEFPHEIGLFLSYPPEDVKGFIDHHACGYKRCGLWKVYGDEKRAERLFDQFRRCTDQYCWRWRAGFGLEQLAVSI